MSDKAEIRLRERYWRGYCEKIESEINYLKKYLDMELTNFKNKLLEEKDRWEELDAVSERGKTMESSAEVSAIESLFEKKEKQWRLEKEQMEIRLREMELKARKDVNELKEYFSKRIADLEESLTGVYDGIKKQTKFQSRELELRLQSKEEEGNLLKNQLSERENEIQELKSRLEQLSR